MRYRIEYADGRCCNFANGRAELLKWLKLLKQEEISDIRKVYKSGIRATQRHETLRDAPEVHSYVLPSYRNRNRDQE